MKQNFAQVEGAAMNVNCQDSEQHQHRAGQRVEKELDRSRSLALAAFGDNQEIHWHQQQFPENVKQHQVERHKHAQHGGLQQQKQDVEFFVTRRSRVPGRSDGHRAQQRCQQHHHHAQSVQAQPEVHAERGNPVRVRDELKRLGGIGFKFPEQRQRNNETEQPKGVGQFALQILASRRNKPKHQRAHQRREQDRRQNVLRRKEHTVPFSESNGARDTGNIRDKPPAPGPSRTGSCAPSRFGSFAPEY